MFFPKLNLWYNVQLETKTLLLLVILKFNIVIIINLSFFLNIDKEENNSYIIDINPFYQYTSDGKIETRFCVLFQFFILRVSINLSPITYSHMQKINSPKRKVIDKGSPKSLVLGPL